MIGRAGSLASIRSYGDCGMFDASAFDRGETLTASITRLDRADAIYWQQRAKDNATLAAYALDIRALTRAAEFQRTASYFAAEALRSLSRLIENGSETDQ